MGNSKPVYPLIHPLQPNLYILYNHFVNICIKFQGLRQGPCCGTPKGEKDVTPQENNIKLGPGLW